MPDFYELAKAVIQAAVDAHALSRPEDFRCEKMRALAHALAPVIDWAEEGAAPPPGAARYKVYLAIDSERAYQDRLWPGPNDGSNRLEAGEFLPLLAEYVRQAEAVWVKEPKQRDGEGLELPRTMDAIRKVAGIAVNCMEQHGAPLREA